MPDAEARLEAPDKAAWTAAAMKAATARSTLRRCAQRFRSRWFVTATPASFGI
jgi:hypothetical protein